MSSQKYSEPVSSLLTITDRPSSTENWVDYKSLGLSVEHMDELIRMLTDDELHLAPSDSAEVWAPVHAWRALGQMCAVDAVMPLIAQLRRIDEEWDDAVGEEMPIVFAMLGAPAVKPLGNYLRSHSNGIFARVCAAHSLGKIGSEHGELRDECVLLLTRQLAEHDLNHPVLNGFLVYYLLSLRAVEAIDHIREAYAHERVDLHITGDVENVEMELGFRKERSTPEPQLEWEEERMRGNPLHPETLEKGKIGRNDPCPCESGKKYKFCCNP